CQCRSQRVPGSSRNGSHPSLPKSSAPSLVGFKNLPRLLGTSESSSSSPNASAQCRIDTTMFLPTPSRTSASSAENAFGSSTTASTAFLGQLYRNGNVW